MAMPVRQIITATGNGTPVNLDWLLHPPNTTVQGGFASGATATYIVQETNDDINDLTITPIWVNDPVLNGLSAGGVNVLTSPYRWVRCTVSAITGTIYFYVIQGMSAR